MLRGLYTAATGMATQRSRMDVTTNNIVNAETTGFKADNLLSRSFRDMLIERINDPSIVMRSNEVGPLNTGIHIDEIVTDFVQGSLQTTDVSTDFALVGDGFFVIETPAGERYSRMGSFTLDGLGRIVNADGNFLLGQNGYITVPGDDFVVNEDGTVTYDGAYIDTIRVTTFEDAAALRKEGNGMFFNYGGSAQGAFLGVIKQGMLEASNVNLGTEAVRMIEISRAHELNQRVVRTQDEMLSKLSDLARV